MKLAFFTTALMASSVAIAATPIDGWYNSLFGGYTGILDNFSVTRFGLHGDRADYKGGFNAGGRFGYQCHPLRYELELTYLQAKLEGYQVNFIPQEFVEGQTSGIFGMANIYYDFPDIVTAVQPFLGLGIGYGWVEGSFESDGPFALTYYKANGSVFAYQATGGFTYNFAENYAVNIAYRYIGTDRVDDLGKILQAHLGSIGVIYRFDEAYYK